MWDGLPSVDPEEIWASDWQSRFKGFIGGVFSANSPRGMLPEVMNTKSIPIPDFGIGNFASIIRMAGKSVYSCAIARQPEELMSVDTITLAGY